jgi:hypothetical protein
MRLPRMTTRRMLVAVAVLAGLLGILRGWETHNRRWATWYGKMADEYQLEVVRLIDDFDRTYQGIYHLDVQKWTQDQKRDWERIWETVNHRDCSYWLTAKHQLAVWRPWTYCAPNRTPPPDPWSTTAPW